MLTPYRALLWRYQMVHHGSALLFQMEQRCQYHSPEHMGLTSPRMALWKISVVVWDWVLVVTVKSLRSVGDVGVSRRARGWRYIQA